MAAPVERLEQLESIEKEIASVLHYAANDSKKAVETNWEQKGYLLLTSTRRPFILAVSGQAIQELSKDKTNVKHMEGHTASFLKTLEAVEMGLSKQIGYLTQVSTGQPHEGSSYASQKVLQMAYHRLEHARSRIADLEKLRNQHMQSRPPIQRQSMPSAAT